MFILLHTDTDGVVRAFGPFATQSLAVEYAEDRILEQTKAAGTNMNDLDAVDAFRDKSSIKYDVLTLTLVLPE